MPKNVQIWPENGIFGQFGPGHAGLLNALSWVGWWLWRAGCISQDTYLLYDNNQNFNMEAVIEGHVEVKSEGDIDDTIKFDTKLNSLEKKKAENVEKKHKDKNKFDLKGLNKNQKEKEKRKRKKEDEDIAERMKFQKGVVNFAQGDKEEESADKLKPKKAKKKKILAVQTSLSAK